jgi:hypothetical protein
VKPWIVHILFQGRQALIVDPGKRGVKVVRAKKSQNGIGSVNSLQLGAHSVRQYIVVIRQYKILGCAKWMVSRRPGMSRKRSVQLRKCRGERQFQNAVVLTILKAAFASEGLLPTTASKITVLTNGHSNGSRKEFIEGIVPSDDSRELPEMQASGNGYELVPVGSSSMAGRLGLRGPQEPTLSCPVPTPEPGTGTQRGQ